MEIRAVSSLRVTSPEGITATPSSSRLVVAQVLEHIFIERVRLFYGPQLSPGILFGNLSYFAVNGHQPVRLQESSPAGRHVWGQGVIAHQAAVTALRVLSARDLILD